MGVVAQIKRKTEREKKILPSSTLASNFVYTPLLLLLLHVLLIAEPSLFRLPTWSDDQALSRNFSYLQHQTGTAEAFCLMGEEATVFSTSPSRKIAIVR